MAYKTPEDIQALKDNWRHDPCYDIEDAEGFEEHREELKAYREERELYWKERAQKRHDKFASMYCPILPEGLGGYAHCLVEQCAWWNNAEECCAIVRRSECR